MSMPDKKKTVSVISFSLLLSFAILVSALYLYNIILWQHYPDRGYGFRVATGIDRIGFVWGQGITAGLQVGDRILSANGRAFSNMQELRNALHHELGQDNVYLIQRGEKQFEVTIKNVPLGLAEAFKRSGYLLLLGLCYLFIGTIVFLMKKHERTSWIFYLFTATLGIFIAFGFRAGRMTPLWLETFNIFVNAFSPAVFIHLALGFPEEWPLLNKHPRIQYLPYIVSAVLFAVTRAATPFSNDMPEALRLFSTVYTASAALIFLASCAWYWRKSESELSRMRSKLILLGSAIAAVVPAADMLMSTFLKVYIVPNTNYLLPFWVFFPLAVGYSIVRYNLFEFDAVIKRTYGYLITTGAVAGVYGLFVLVSNVAFGHLAVTKSQAFPLVFVLLVVFLFNPIRNRVQQFIDRSFYRLEYDYQDTVQKISETMCSLQNMAQVTSSMMDTALGTMFIDSGCLMVLNRGKKTYDCHVRVEKEDPSARFTQNGASGAGDGASISLPFDEPFLKRIAEKKRIVSRYDLEADPFYQEEREAGRKIFDRLGATLVVPIIFENELKGLMGLGNKKSGKFYRIEDIKLLNTLANQGAVAIENAMLLDDVIEKERMEEELSIARDLQTSMLPAVCPRIAGFEIEAICIPAREVGGDFYDFIEISGNRTGIVIGDVTGKGVSGALVMAAARSVFRILSEETSDVGRIMIRANRRAKQDIKEGMFVAILYAIFQAEDRTVRLCSAGQTQPVLFSSRQREARFVDTRGDNFPLGILPDVNYEESLVELSPGDKIVFYTDGIVEAVNETGEMFGFDRFLEVIRNAGTGNAAALMKSIREEVDSFAGKAPQHDDITLIVMGVEN